MATRGAIIRVALPDDAEAIWRAHVESIRVLCAPHYSPQQIEAWAGPKRPDDYRNALGRGEAMYVAESDGRLLGFACRSGDELRGLYVAPSAVGKGVGTALLSRIERDAMAQGVITLRLHSTVNSTAFYQRHGYVAAEPVSRMMNRVAIPCVPMSKVLSDG